MYSPVSQRRVQIQIRRGSPSLSPQKKSRGRTRKYIQERVGGLGGGGTGEKTLLPCCRANSAPTKRPPAPTTPFPDDGQAAAAAAAAAQQRGRDGLGEEAEGEESFLKQQRGTFRSADGIKVGERRGRKDGELTTHWLLRTALWPPEEKKREQEGLFLFFSHFLPPSRCRPTAATYSSSPRPRFSPSFRLLQ